MALSSIRSGNNNSASGIAKHYSFFFQRRERNLNFLALFVSHLCWIPLPFIHISFVLSFPLPVQPLDIQRLPSLQKIGLAYSVGIANDDLFSGVINREQGTQYKPTVASAPLGGGGGGAMSGDVTAPLISLPKLTRPASGGEEERRNSTGWRMQLGAQRLSRRRSSPLRASNYRSPTMAVITVVFHVGP